MIKYERLNKGSFFNILFYELKPLDNNTELKQKYCLNYYQNAAKKAIVFMKDDDFSCHEISTGEVFIVDGNKMYNDKTGLYFYSSYVDNTAPKAYEDINVIRQYFDDAAYYKNNSEQMQLCR